MEKKLFGVTALSGLGAFGGVVLATATPWGLGLSPDSVVYIGAARSLARSNGFSLPTDSGTFAPVVHYPPLYPALLALSSFGGADVIAVARWLNIFLFCANVFLAGIIGYRVTGLFRFAVITACLVATAFPMTLVHSMVWSDPLFVFCQSVGLLCLLSYFREFTRRSLVAAALATGLSVLGRYAGVSLVMSGVAAILWLGADRWKKKFLDAGIFLVVSLLPIGLWVARNQWIAGTPTNRKIGFHPAGLGELSAAIKTIGGWFSAFWTSSTDVQFLSVCVVVTSGLVIGLSGPRFAVRHEPANAARLKIVSSLMALVAANYLALLLLTISLFDAQTPVDSRLLAPCYIPLVLLVVSALTFPTSRWQERARFRSLALAVGLLIIGLQLPATLNWLRQHYRQGIGYSSRGWRESDTIKQLATRMPLDFMYSNAPDVIYAVLGRPASMIPRKTNSDSNLPNPNYHAEIEQMKRTLQAANGALVFFDRVDWRRYLPSATELESSLGLRLMIKTADGSIYQAR